MNPVSITLIQKKSCFLACFLGIMIGDTKVDMPVLFAGSISIFIGYLLKISREWSKGPIKFKKILLQLVFSFGLGYYAFMYVLGTTWSGMYRQIFLGVVSFSSGEILVIMEEVGKDGFRTYMKNKLNSFLATKPSEPTSPETPVSHENDTTG